MIYGLEPKLEVFASHQARDIKTIQPTEASSRVIEGKESPDVEREEFVKLQETDKIQKITPVKSDTYIEYTLTNFNFGFNNNSKDFFVRAVRGEAENQYPTDDMMRLKAYLLKANAAAADRSLQEEIA